MLRNELRLIVPSANAEPETARHTALLVVRDARLVNAITRILHASHVDMITCSDASGAASWLDRNNINLVICDFDLVRASGVTWLASLNEHPSRPAVIIISANQDPERLGELLETNDRLNMVAKLGELDNGDLLVTVRKLVENDLFGVDKYLRWGSVIHGYDLHSTACRQEVLNRLEGFLRQLRCRNNIISRMLTVADEFITNALYDAPVDTNGQSLYAKQPRTIPVSLPREQAIQVQFGSDGRLLAIGCRDPFGSLSPERLRRSLARCLRRGPDQVSQGPGGAGIGLYMVFQYVTHLVVNLDPGRSTEFIGVVDVTAGARTLHEQPHSLNFFIERR